MNQIKISVLALALLMTGAVDGISNLPSIALFGEKLIFFFIAASLLFLLPAGLISAELCTHFKEEGGIYLWVKKAFGKNVSILAIWLQWINTMVWFPMCLTTLVGTAAYIINPKLTNNPWYLVCASNGAFWLMTYLNLKGIKTSTKIATWATTLGMLVPMITIISLSMLWILLGNPLQIHATAHNIIPPLTKLNSWNSLTAIITAFLGMELATVHVRKIKNAASIFPKALIISIVIIVLTLGIGSLGIAYVIPAKEIVLVAGTIQAFHTLFAAFHLTWLEPILGGLLIFGSLGAMINWLVSPANGLLQAGQDGFLPSWLAKENEHAYPKNILILQAIVVTFISSAFFLMPSVNGSYWLLLDLSTELYVMMYILMFIVAIKFTFTLPNINIIPGKKLGALLFSLSGLSGSLITFIVGFFPPSNINIGSAWHFIFLFSGGLLLMISPVLLLLAHKKRNSIYVDLIQFAK